MSAAAKRWAGGWTRARVQRVPSALTLQILHIAAECLAEGSALPSSRKLYQKTGATIQAVDVAINTLIKQRCLWIHGAQILEVRI